MPRFRVTVETTVITPWVLDAENTTEAIRLAEAAVESFIMTPDASTVDSAASEVRTVAFDAREGMF